MDFPFQQTASATCGLRSVISALNMAEVDGNRTRQAEIIGFVGFEDRGDHQVADTSLAATDQANVTARLCAKIGRSTSITARSRHSRPSS